VSCGKIPDVQRTWQLSRVIASGLVAAAVLGACSDTTVKVPEPGAIAIPTFQTLPDDLYRSPQLRALQPRDTAGLEVDDEESAAADLLPAALAALQASDDAPTKLSRLLIYNGYVDFTYEQNGINGRSVSATYRPDDDMYFGTPTYDDTPTFAIDMIDPVVPADLVEAIERQVPNGKVNSLRLDISSSYDFGLVWNISVVDARGSLATVFADLDGAIVAVDLT